MKKRIFKFGVTLTAAMMVFASMSSLAFADEVDASADEEIVVEAAAEEDAVVEDTEDAEAADVIEVAVPLETEEVDVEEALAVTAAEDVATGSVIAIGTISAVSDDNYYTVTVPFTIDGTAPDQLTFFVYDITGITDGNNTTAYTSSTPVGYINQYDGAKSGTYTFKLSKSAYTDDSVIVVKIGGTDVATPDAKSYSLAGTQTAEIGDVDNNGDVNNLDAVLVLRYYSKMIDETGLDLSVADAYDDGTGTINNLDAVSILKYYSKMLTTLPEVK